MFLSTLPCDPTTGGILEPISPRHESNSREIRSLASPWKCKCPVSNIYTFILNHMHIMGWLVCYIAGCIVETYPWWNEFISREIYSLASPGTCEYVGLNAWNTMDCTSWALFHQSYHLQTTSYAFSQLNIKYSHMP